MAATAQQEVESLDRVLTRLATTEEANLEKVGKATHTHACKPLCSLAVEPMTGPELFCFAATCGTKDEECSPKCRC